MEADGADEALAHRLTSCRAQSDGCTRAGRSTRPPTSASRRVRCSRTSAGSEIPPSSTGASRTGGSRSAWSSDRRGPRLQFELEQLLPGGEDPDAPDPILEAVALRDRGQPARARALLDGLIEWDCRCLDAHAHLGALDFDDDPGAAQAHHATGVRIAQSSLPEDFGGVLGWGWIDNRHSYAACTA